MSEAHSAVISSSLVLVFFLRLSRCCYLYSLLFHFCHCVNIYSDWLGEQFCYLSLIMLYVLTVQ